MSTEDDRPRYSGGYSDSGYPDSGYSDGGTLRGSSYPGGGAHARFDPDDFGGVDFDDAGYSTQATIMADNPTAIAEDEFERPKPVWHAGADIGLLILRLVLGGTFVAHGLQKVFGLFGGPGIDGFARGLQGAGFTQPTILAWATGVAELGGGALVVLGLFTPLGAAAILGVMANVIYLKWNTGFFLTVGTTASGPMAQGFEWELALAGAAFALMFTGPGRVSLDRPTPWFRNPLPFGLVALVLSAGLTVAALLAFR